MTDAPAFTQIQTGSALYALTPAAAAGWSGYWSPATASSQSGLTLDQAWANTGGVYIWSGKAPADTQAMADGLAGLIPEMSSAGLLRMVWIENPDDPSDHWQTHSLLARQVGGNAWELARTVNFSGGGYGVYMQAGARLTQSTPAEGGCYGIAIGGTNNYFLAPKGAFAITEGSCFIALSGTGIGAIMAQLPVTAAANADVFQQLSVGLRYTYPTLSKRSGATDHLDMPVFSQGGLSFTFYLSFFPGSPLNPDLSSVSFFPVSGSGSAPALPCYLRTVLGYGTTLTPLAAEGTLPAGRLVFGASPRWKPGARRSVGSTDYNLCPDGSFLLATLTPPAHQFNDPDGVVDKVMLGASGTEYTGLTALSGCIALFAGGAPAYAPALMATAGSDDGKALLTLDATTAAATFLPPASTTGNLIYFAQPRQSPLYQAGDTGFLDFLELPAAQISNTEANLPLGIYAGIGGSQTAAARLLEQAVLAPARNQAAMKGPGSVRGTASLSGALIQGITPPGLCVTVSPDRGTWQSVILAQMSQMTPNNRIFSSVGKDLQSAMQADQLFFVVSEPSVLAPPVDQCVNGECTSVQYRLDQTTLSILAEEGVDSATITALTNGLAPLGYPTYATKNAFVAMLKQFAPAISDADELKTLAIAGQLSIEIDHWMFQLSPDSWRLNSGSPTMMLVKYANGMLEELVADLGRWGFPGAAGDEHQTQSNIQAIFDAARQSFLSGTGDAYASFYEDVVINPAWNGFLFLNAPVNTAELPTELLFLTAGIDMGKFYAHHLAVGATPYKSDNGALTLGQSSISGLIDYNDTSDLVMEASIPFAFKTQQLTAVFKNTALVDFKARCELMINQLFEAETTKTEAEHGNNLVISGGYQRQNGEPVYSFVLTGLNDFSLARSALMSVSVASVQIQTAATDATNIKVSFLLSGKMRFIELPLFDLFSYGVPLSTDSTAQADADSALAFSNLAILMGFDLGDPTNQNFVSIPNDIAFDLSNSQARAVSLVDRFPVKLTGFAVGTSSSPAVGAPATSPEDLGYSGISAPLDASVMVAPWFGLVYSLDMGTLGALSGGKPLIMSVLAGWCVGKYDNVQPVYLGLKMPDGRPLGIDWPLQGVLHLGFRSFDFVASGEGEQRSYMLRMRRFGLSALGMSFPPGNLDVFLFGDPSGGNSGKLGWYAAYVPDSSGTKAVPAPRSASRQLADGKTPRRLTRTDRLHRNGRRPRLPNTGL